MIGTSANDERSGDRERDTPVSMPVVRLGASARAAYREHLLALDADDRRMRFGTALGAAALLAYVERIDFDRDVVFGVHDERLDLVGATHVAFADALAELGVSVLRRARGRGIGAALVERAADHARNRSITRLYMHCLAENAAMVRIARHAGMAVVFEAGDADAEVALPPATPASFARELFADRLALYDYALKSQVETWRRVTVAWLRPAA